jgi:hypothetical protein
VAVNDLAGSWEVIEAAAANSDGTASFLSDFQLSRVGADPAELTAEHGFLEEIFPFLEGERLMQPHQVTVATRDVLPALSECDFLKLDIQGGEWDILMDARFEQVSPVALVAEAHPQGCPGDDPLTLATQRLEAAGFSLEPPAAAHGGEWVLWAVREPG